MGLRAVDLFCGAGGIGAGARARGFRIVAAFDASKLAGKVYSDNFPEARFYHSKPGELNAADVAKSLGNVAVCAPVMRRVVSDLIAGQTGRSTE